VVDSSTVPARIRSGYRPDANFAVVPGRPRSYSAHPTTADLIVEVANTSISFDTNEKRLIYATAGIRDYWVVNINARRLIVFRDPQSGDFASRQEFGVNDSVAPLAVPTASIRVADLLE
jgi:Uma2 family endonuclease